MKATKWGVKIKTHKGEKEPKGLKREKGNALFVGKKRGSSGGAKGEVNGCIWRQKLQEKSFARVLTLIGTGRNGQQARIKLQRPIRRTKKKKKPSQETNDLELEVDAVTVKHRPGGKNLKLHR